MANEDALRSGYSYFRWWPITWRKHSGIGRKLATLLFFVLILGYALMIVTAVFQPDNPDRGPMIGFGIAGLVFLWSWPFLLIVGGPRATHAGVPCCAGCGAFNSTLRRTRHQVGFCLFGLIPIAWKYKRVLCDRCRGGIIRGAIVLENLFSMIFFPVGTILGIVWIVKNSNDDNTIDVEGSLELSAQLPEPGTMPDGKYTPWKEHAD